MPAVGVSNNPAGRPRKAGGALDQRDKAAAWIATLPEARVFGRAVGARKKKVRVFEARDASGQLRYWLYVGPASIVNSAPLAKNEIIARVEWVSQTGRRCWRAARMRLKA